MDCVHRTSCRPQYRRVGDTPARIGHRASRPRPRQQRDAEFDAGGALLTEYAWLEDRHVAVIDHSGTAPETHFVHTDHLERLVMVTGAGATLVWRAACLPSGEVAPLMARPRRATASRASGSRSKRLRWE